MKRLLALAALTAVAVTATATPASALCVKEPRHGHYLFCLT